MLSTDGYDFLGESIRDDLEDIVEKSTLNLQVQVESVFKSTKTQQKISTSLTLHCVDSTQYDYIGENVRDNLESLIISLEKLGYNSLCVRIFVTRYLSTESKLNTVSISEKANSIAVKEF